MNYQADNARNAFLALAFTIFAGAMFMAGAVGPALIA